MNLNQRRQAEFEKYRKVYRDFPRYTNRQVRIDLTREWIESRIQDQPYDCHLLDVGAGRGEVIDMAAKQLFVVAIGCEVVPELCNGLVDKIPGAHALPYKSTSFDLVTCTDVMEHILEDDVPAVLSELARVARGPVLLTICHIHDRGRGGRGEPHEAGKYGPDVLHITVHPREWWEERIRKYMDPVSVRALYTDRVNQNGTWFEVLCG